MNLFFGKISQKYNIKQIEAGYFKAPKGSTWFGELELGDYVFLIGGGRIQFWQAHEWGFQDGEECLHFNVLNKDLGIKINNLISLNFLKLTKELIVLTVRSASNRAFFKLDLISDISLKALKESSFYLDENIYRSIKIINEADIQKDTKDIQLYFSNDKFEVYKASFIDDGIMASFKNNLSSLGKEAKMKDTVLEKVKKALDNLPVEFKVGQLSIKSFYDTFFCDCKENGKYFLVGAYWKDNEPEDMTDLFLKQSIWKNGFDDKFTKEVNGINEGDNIAIKSTYTRNKTISMMLIKARGIVKKNIKDGHTLEIEWEDDFEPFELPIGSYRNTVKEITNKDHIQEIWYTTDIETNYGNSESDYKMSLNQILYGPPGTGKTYNTIDIAVKIIDGVSSENRSINKSRFDKLKNDNQIEFVTFHQNYSYEDFMVGLRPDPEDAILRFKPHKGIFYKIAQRAKENYYASKEERSLVKDFETILTELFEPLESGDEIEVKMASGISYFITDITSSTIRFRKSNNSTNHTLSIDTLKEIVEGTRTLNSGLLVYYNPLAKLIKEKQKDVGSTHKEALKRYVLIIDEINRANISRVFGELITLLEDDKRLGGDNELKITLPNDEKNFGVPPNLYVVGTMNTADKSIALLDIALRRRFEFISKYPDYSVLLPDRAELLKKINDAIYRKKNTADYLIGHAYFLSEYATENILLKKVIPLLNEYFGNRISEVENIFSTSNWTAKYNEQNYCWEVSKKNDIIDVKDV